MSNNKLLRAAKWLRRGKTLEILQPVYISCPRNSARGLTSEQDTYYTSHNYSI